MTDRLNLLSRHREQLERFLQAPTPLSNRVKGNLGEFVAYKVGETYAFVNGVLAFDANAWAPLSEISRPDLDIVWLYFGPSPADDGRLSRK